MQFSIQDAMLLFDGTTPAFSIDPLREMCRLRLLLLWYEKAVLLPRYQIEYYGSFLMVRSSSLEDACKLYRLMGGVGRLLSGDSDYVSSMVSSVIGSGPRRPSHS